MSSSWFVDVVLPIVRRVETAAGYMPAIVSESRKNEQLL
jgi:hypothetical protein